MSKNTTISLNELRGIMGVTQNDDSPSETFNTGKDLDDMVLSKSCWAQADGNYWAVGQTCPVVPCNLYEAAYSDKLGYYLKGLTNNTDSIIDLPDSESEKLLEEIQEFTTLKDMFKKHGFLYKRGILLWGPPGSGKTVTIQQLIRLFTKTENGIAVICKNPNILVGVLRDFREVEQERQILVILEDLDSLIEMYGESEFLDMLDGEAQLQNVVYVATTNYPEKLDDRFKDRPSRFDTIRKIGMPTESARRVYLKTKLPNIEEVDLEEYVVGSKGYSVAYLRELIVLTQCFNKPLDEAFKRLDSMQSSNISSTKNGDGDSNGFGFVSKK